ncbi:hypothetical protein, partial [Klebsiella michiganensis]|uniref:hypothetical protein n=1 Tax=Klebsiella michiganensis TaxID=1134687 RepID=UPI001A7E6E0E
RYCCGFFPACAALSRATGPQIAGNPSPDRRIAPPPGLWQMLILFHPLILFAEEIHQPVARVRRLRRNPGNMP